MTQLPATDDNRRAKKVNGFVTAGGGSKRFGEDKARAIFAGKPILVRTCDLVASVTGTPQVIAPLGRYDDLRVQVIADHWPGEGPLAGIITALLHTRNARDTLGWNLIVSCDMPFLSREWLLYLVASALKSESEVLVPRSTSGLEPLCACWRTSSAPTLQKAFDAGVRKVTEAMKQLRMEVLDEAHWKRFDSAGRLFWNMNTAADYLEAQRILGEQK